MGPAPLRIGALALAAVSALLSGCVPDPEAQMCDAGIYCPAGTKCAPNQAVCLNDDCGDGVVQAWEACDDGDIISGRLDADGKVISSGTCNADCTSDETCGNGETDEEMGEVCDDGNRADGDHCSADCSSTEYCGNGTPDPGEECDTGLEPSEYCNYETCTVSRHGDGIVNPLDGEACDDGAPDDVDPNDGCESAACNADCTVSRHGDGIVNPLHGEACDDGTPDAVDPTDGCESSTCDTDCTRAACGDGLVNLLAGEACDDGNAVETDDCRTTCEWNFCGDGWADLQGPVVEACDLGALNGVTECAYGLQSCVGCSTTCTTLPAEAMETDYCGDGVDDGAMEECDATASFACGTCDAAACSIVDVQDAQGSVEVLSAAVADGDYLVIADGLGGEATLEFDTAGGCEIPGATCIAVSTADTTSAIAGLIDARLDALYDAKALAISSALGTSSVDLANVEAGIAGNVPIVAGSAAGTPPPAFVVQGMSGGLGCPEGDACFASRDCVSNRCSREGLCLAPR